MLVKMEMGLLKRTLCGIVMVIFLSSHLITNVRTHDSIKTFDQFYDMGMDAYKKENWERCILSFNKSLDNYKFYRNTVVECRLQCQESRKMVEKSSYEELLFGILKDSKCLRKCKLEKFAIRPEEEISRSYEKRIQDRRPYNYLQFCYFKVSMTDGSQGSH